MKHAREHLWLSEKEREKLLSLELAASFDFLLHAAEDEGKTEDPTEHKKRKAREEEGRVFLTQELPQAAVLIISVSLIVILSTYFHEVLNEMMVKYLENPQGYVFSEENMGMLFKDAIYGMLIFILPIGGAGMLTVILTSMIQTQFHFSWASLKINVQRISPTWENFKKRTIFSRSQLIQITKIFIKILLIGLTSYFFLRFHYPQMVSLPQGSLLNAYAEMGWMIYKLVLIIGIMFLALAVPDWYIQRFEYLESLKMTKQEVKQEYKELEGDPQIRARIRERARELATRDVMNKVKEADVLLTNPTHFSCAIQYEIETMDAPKLLAKGQDLVALKMRETAKENNIPIVENKPLARSLYAHVDMDSFIPLEYYGAIAEILAALDKFKKMT